MEQQEQQRFTLNCTASAARAKLNSAIRSIGFALEAPVSGKAKQELQANAVALQTNLEALNKLQDEILKAANTANDSWLRSAAVCPVISFPSVASLEPMLKEAGQVRSQVPLGLDPVITPTVIVIGLVVVGVSVLTISMTADNFRKSLLALQGIGATADVEDITGKQVLKCLAEAGDNPEAVAVCNQLASEERAVSLARISSKEGGLSLTTAVVLSLGAVLAITYLRA